MPEIWSECFKLCTYSPVNKSLYSYNTNDNFREDPIHSRSASEIGTRILEYKKDIATIPAIGKIFVLDQLPDPYEYIETNSVWQLWGGLGLNLTKRIVKRYPLIEDWEDIIKYWAKEKRFHNETCLRPTKYADQFIPKYQILKVDEGKIIEAIR